MNRILLLSIFLFPVLFQNCNGNSETDPIIDTNDSLDVVLPSDSVVLSFAFVGCNRVDKGDRHLPAATDSSSANIAVLARIFREVVALERQPDMFFFLGDMVLGESSTHRLNDELSHWLKLYADTTQVGSISASGIEMIAIPGNHEMLYSHDYPDDTVHHEFPLQGSTDLWMQYMSQFMPEDRDYVEGLDSLANRMTFAFVRKNVGFVLMNTDTYNAPSAMYKRGREGIVPIDWVSNKVTEYKNNPTIDHVFVLGHKPAYVNGEFDTIHEGFLGGEELWKVMMQESILAMLSAHDHTYSRVQPEQKGTYQVIAGNGGSSNPAFFGYTIINIMSSGKVQLISKGFNNDGTHYYNPSSSKTNPTTTRDSTELIWGANPFGG